MIRRGGRPPRRLTEKPTAADIGAMRLIDQRNAVFVANSDPVRSVETLAIFDELEIDHVAESQSHDDIDVAASDSH